MNVKILPSARKHGLTDEEVSFGIAGTLESVIRENDKTGQMVRFSLGVLPDGRVCEFLSFFEDDIETIVVFHALVPPTQKFLKMFRKR